MSLTNETESREDATPRKSIKQRLDELFELYGYTALAVWLAIGITTFGSFYLAIEAGVDTTPVSDWAVAQGCTTAEEAERSGTVAAACIGCQATKPLRFALTALLVPIVARFRKPPAST